MPPDTPAWQAPVERWLRRCAGGPAPAVILGAAANGLSFARSLGRRRTPVLLLDSQMFLGMFTRFAVSVRLPPVETDPQTWIDLLEFVGARLARPAALLPTADATCLLIARHAARLRVRFRLSSQTLESVERIINKRAQYEAAQAAGLALPATHYPETAEEARLVAERVQYPCLFKPCVAHLGWKHLAHRKVLVVESAAALIAAYEKLARLDTPFLVQEVVPGDDSAVFGYLAFWDDEGRELAWLTVQKLRQNPPCYGEASLLRTVEAPEVSEHSRRLLRALDCRGFAGVEFKRDQRDGSLRLIEANPRSEAFVEAAVRAGLDLPWISYQYLSGADTPRPGGFRPGVTCVMEELDIQSFRGYRAAGALTIGRWLRSLQGAQPIVWAWDDPMPMLAGLARYAGLLGRMTPRPAAAAPRPERNGAVR